jgi:omega-6 fatty acid desaturase / acyl-lipid omega-6 desaturase (Delta-12 desaturase)
VAFHGITHSKHYTFNLDAELNQVFARKTPSEVGLNPSIEDLPGAGVSNEIKQKISEAIGDSPIDANSRYHFISSHFASHSVLVYY